MTFPFEFLSGTGREWGLLVGVLIGFGFGFVLERAGFGRAPKLAAQFYGTDLTVFKVMFGAIVTALLGTVILSGLGFSTFKVIADQVVSATFLWPMILGGLALGAGFIISGYCPGTSVVAMASGKWDGFATVGGVIVGQLLYAEVEHLGWFARFHTSSNLGHTYLWELFKLNDRVGPAVLAVGVTAMAVGCFLMVEKLEATFRARATVDAMPTPAGIPGKRVFIGYGAAALLGLLLALAPARAVPNPTPASISSLDLARRVLDAPWSLRVLDLRSAEAYASSRIPGSESVAPAQLGKLGLGDAPASRDLVLIVDGDLAAVPPAATTFPGRVYALKGGFAAWQREVLTAPAPLAPGASPETVIAWKLQAGIQAGLTGMKAAPPPPAAAAGGAPRKMGGGGCGG